MSRLAAFATAAALLAVALPARAVRAETLSVVVPQKGNWDTSITEYGVRQGFFKQEGLTIKLIYSQGGASTMQAVISGSVDIGVANGLLGTVGAYAKGAPVRVIAAEMTGAPDLFWYARTSSGIHTLKDCAGKTIAFSEPGSSTDLVLHALLQQAGVTARPVPAGGIPATLTQVMSGQIAVGWSVPPFNLAAVQNGTLAIVAHGNDEPAIRDETIRVNFVSARALKTKRAAIEKFARAYVKSLNWAYTHPQAIAYFAEGTHVSEAIAQKARDDFYPRSAMEPFQIHGEALMLKQALAYKFISHPMTPKDIAGMFDILGQPKPQ